MLNVKSGTDCFPRGLFEAYAQKKITKSQFLFSFSVWQKKHGTNYDTKGFVSAGALYLMYRGIGSEVHKGRIFFNLGNKTYLVGNIFEFRRRVDFAMLEKKLWEGGSGCTEVTL